MPINEAWLLTALAEINSNRSHDTMSSESEGDSDNEIQQISLRE